MNKSIWAEKSSFFKIDLKRVLTLPKARSRREHSKSSGFIGIGLTCVELRPFYCRKIILVPMSYISFWGPSVATSTLANLPMPVLRRILTTPTKRTRPYVYKKVNIGILDDPRSIIPEPTMFG